ncbi:MAG TPA: NlpC/P60 family protein [Bdellovibrionota bacterium]|jgi:cell wall-associated NlpC family hydrolase|nr:NlpC/P60 family protein [Bdellovibrionota bacterium]
MFASALARAHDTLHANFSDICTETLARYSAAMERDFAERDLIPQSPYGHDLPFAEWQADWGAWGPPATRYPQVEVPADFVRVPGAARKWLEARVVSAAQRFLGVPFQKRHVPGAGGLDCSNFTAWVYNYALGVQVDSNIFKQSENAGRLLGAGESWRPGDLIFLLTKDHSRIVHVAIYLGGDEIIDLARADREVRIHKIEGRYVRDFAWARRVIE